MSQRTLHTWVAVTVAVVVVGIFFIIGIPFSTSSLNSEAGTQTAMPSQLAIHDEATGTGKAAQPGDRITVNYTGRLSDGTVFDTSVGKTPFSFTLGTGEVISGWDQGLVGAQAGTKRTIVVPPDLGYGPQDYGPIPGNSTLIFDVDVISVTPGSAH